MTLKTSGDTRCCCGGLLRSTRSLTLDDLAECIGIDFEEDSESMDFDSVETYSENLLKRCSSLVTVSDDGRVSLAHSTVKEFLVSETTRNDLSAFYIGVEEVEIELAQTCLTYLCYNDFIAGSITDEEALEETMSKYRSCSMLQLHGEYMPICPRGRKTIYWI